MENFKRRTSGSRDQTRRASVDGFTRRQSGVGSREPAVQARTARRVGDFSHTDGFHARSRRSMSTPRQPRRDDSGAISLNLPDSSGAEKHKKGFLNWYKAKKLPKLRTVALVFVIAFGSYFITSAYLKARQVFQGGGGAVALQGDIDPARLQGEGDGRVNILLLGTDDAAALTDTIIVASIDPIHDEAALLSIPRDLYVQREGLGSMKINEVFPNEHNRAMTEQATTRQADVRGYRAIQDTVSEVTGIPMHYYVSIDIDGFQRAIDTVGGVTMNVEDPVYEVLSLEGQRYVLNVQPGEQEFDGLRAMAYVRSRKTSPRGDFDRSERQRELLIALKNEIVSSGTWSNPNRISGLFNDFSDNVTTSFGIDEIMRLREIADDIGAQSVSSLELVGDEPNNFITSSNLNGLSIQVPREGMYEYSEIQNYVRNTLRDGYLRQENANVLVVNGTNQPDLAERTTKQLESFGYNVAPPQSAELSNYQETVLVDLTMGEKKYTKRYLEQRMKTFASSRLPSGVSINTEGIDFVILIGQNEITRLEN